MTLTLQSFSVTISSSTLLDSVDACLMEGERVALVGENGCGKSTLLRILYNSEMAESSYWTVSSGNIGGSLSPSQRLADSVLLVNQDVLSWSNLWPGTAASEEELRELSLSDALDLAIAEGVECACDDEESWRRVCIAADRELNWSLADYSHTPLGKLSPGSALRAYLAIAIHRPGVRLLLLDEPTNHLDLPSILWLQQSLLESDKTLIIVSHDEAFLDAIANRIWEVDDMKLTVSSATYSDFKKAKSAAIEQQKKTYDEQQKRHKRLTEAADRLREASLAGEQHRARDHDLMQRGFKRNRAGRSGKKAAAVEKLRDGETMVERVIEKVPLSFKLEPVAASGGYDVSSSILLDDIRLAHGVRHLPFINWRISYGERVAILGFNAVGKSTLLRTILGNIEPTEGSVKIGRDLRIGDLMQEHESLPRDVTPRDYIAERTGLGRFVGGNRVIGFGLTRHQVDSPIQELNPGARARLLLATFSMRNVNVLVLDEPTNHLDEEAVEELIASLNTYEGTIIVVSHDRHFLSSLKLNTTLLLSSSGLQHVQSVDVFVETMQDAAARVVQHTFR